MTTKTNQSKTPAAPNFKDVDKEAATRAQAALAGGKQEPLKAPKTAKTSEDKNGREYTRWNEKITITQAYRSITKKGLMDVTVIGKIRQSKDNTGSKVFGHFYLNMSDSLPDGHAEMNDRSHGAIISLLTAVSLMPTTGGLKGSLLDKMFPPKNQPGTSSPLNGKSAIANVVQTLEPQKNQKTGKVELDDEGEPIMQKRDGIESFLPDESAAAKKVAASDEDEDEDEE